MTRHLVFALFAALVLTSCSPSAPRKAAEIDKLEKELAENGKKNFADTTKVKELMSDYKYYVNTFPTDSLTPVYLMKEGKFYDAIYCPDSAISCYSQVYSRFPAYPKAGFALFSEAFIVNNEKHDLVKAKALYEEYLSKYPNTKLTKSVELELKNLGKTPDQILSELDSLNKAHKDSVSKKR
jgi:tetratricopeptide (TPR) repeat protein